MEYNEPLNYGNIVLLTLLNCWDILKLSIQFGMIIREILTKVEILLYG